MKKTLSFAIIAVFLAFPLLLDASICVVKGQVTDPKGKPLKDAKITLVDSARGQTYVMKTNKSGEYFQMGIYPAEYKIKVEKKGFISLEGKADISPEQENVFNAVLAPEVIAPVRAEWEETNVQANKLYQENKFEEALKLYQEILFQNAGLTAIHFNAGNCLYHLGKYEESVASFKEAIRIKPDFFESYINLANAYGKLKKFDEAVPLFEEALKTYPESPALLSSAGLLYLNSGMSDKAVESLEKAASLDPQASFHLYSLGIAYTQKGDLTKAIESYEKYLALNADPKEAARVGAIVDQLKAMEKK